MLKKFFSFINSLFSKKKKKRKTILVNFFGGPGAGKSTMRAGLFYFLKTKGIYCEEAMEYAKGKVYEGSDPVLKNQLYVFGKQHHITFRIKDHVDVVISESPLLLSIVYDSSNNEDFRKMVLNEHNKFDYCLNYYLVRPDGREYQSYGRLQDETGAKKIDDIVLGVLEQYEIPYKVVPSTHESLMEIVDEVLEKLKSNEQAS